MKMADVTPVYKKRSRSVKDNYHLEVFCPNCQKYLKDACINNYHHILIPSCQKVNVDLEKIIVFITKMKTYGLDSIQRH